jgi:hypothetical protein
MARIEVLEGTWEELAAHADEFKGRRLRLIVLPEGTEATASTPDEAVLREAAARLFAAADSSERIPGEASTDPRKVAFGDIITEKYHKMGLKL